MSNDVSSGIYSENEEDDEYVDEEDDENQSEEDESEN